MVENHETGEDAIRREVLEETGYRVSLLEHISTFYVSPGGSSERVILYYTEVSAAGKVESGGGVASEQEDISLVEIPVSEAMERVKKGEIADAKTIIGIMWLVGRQHKGGDGTE